MLQACEQEGESAISSSRYPEQGRGPIHALTRGPTIYHALATRQAPKLATSGGHNGGALLPDNPVDTSSIG